MPEKYRYHEDVWDLLPNDCFVTEDGRRCLVNAKLMVIVIKSKNPIRYTGKKQQGKFLYEFKIDDSIYSVVADTFKEAFGYCDVVDKSIFNEIIGAEERK